MLRWNRTIDNTPELVVQPTGVDDIVEGSNVASEDGGPLSVTEW